MFQQVGSSSSTATCPTAPRFDLFNSSTDNQNNTVILVILTVIPAIILKVLHTLVLKDLIISFLNVFTCQANTSDKPRAAVAYHFVASKVTSKEDKQIQKEHKPFAILNTHMMRPHVIIAIVMIIVIVIIVIVIMLRWLQRFDSSLFLMELITPRC